MTVFLKPKDEKKKPNSIRVMKDGREVLNLLTKAGRDEYMNRIETMRLRQNKRCCLEGYIAGCPGTLNKADATFEHEAGRGHGGGHRDDRIEINGKWINGAAHATCNAAKGSRRINYNYADVP